MNIVHKIIQWFKELYVTLLYPYYQYKADKEIADAILKRQKEEQEQILARAILYARLKSKERATKSEET